MTETIPIAEAQARLLEIVDRVARDRDRFYLTRDGRLDAVIMSSDELESLEESLEIHHDDELMRSLRTSRREAARGKLQPLEDDR